MSEHFQATIGATRRSSQRPRFEIPGGLFSCLAGTYTHRE